MPDSVYYDDIVQAIRECGLVNSGIALHSSLKSFGHLDGGPDTLLRAFLDLGCSLLVPTFTYECEAPPQQEIPRNGLGASYVPNQDNTTEYDSNGSLISTDMGNIPARVLQTAARVRGHHPLNSFAALGPLAQALIAGQQPLNVYGPYKGLYAQPRAYLVLAGVDLIKATPIHFAEEQAGRRLFHRWGRQAGQIIECEVGSCSEGFNRLSPYVEPIEQKISVGPSLWRVYPFREFIDRISAAIRADPGITHCENPDCERCEDAAHGGPVL